MVELHYHSKTFNLPENYNELTGDQLLKINELINNNIPKPMLRLMLLRILLSLSIYQFFKLDADCKNRILFYDRIEEEFLSNDDDAATSIDWLFEANDLTEQLLPVYNGYYGPKKEFDNLRMKEFHVTEMNYADYVMDENEDALNSLVAVLYRPSKPDYNLERDTDGDIRIPFNVNEFEYYKKIVAEWPLHVKQSIFQFYDGNREYLKTLYERVFETSSSNTNDSGENEPGMFDVIRNLSGSKYGTFADVEEMLVHNALKEIEASIIESEKTEQAST